MGSATAPSSGTESLGWVLQTEGRERFLVVCIALAACAWHGSQVLNLMEMTGGDEAFINIKYMVRRRGVHCVTYVHSCNCMLVLSS